MKEIFCPSDIASYAMGASRGEGLILHKLREETMKLPEAGMMVSPLQGRFLELLIRWGGAQRILEVGTFTGYSALSMALALPEGGQITTLDKHVEWTKTAQHYWELAGVSSKINLRLGLAHETLETLTGPFDMMFIDADKQRYKVYYEFGLKLLRPGGLLAFDNTLWGGTVADPTNEEDTPRYLRAFNTKLREDDRVYPILLPLADGITLAVKR